MKTIKIIAACALWISAGATFGHEGTGHAAHDPAAFAPQPWGVAAAPQAATRTVAVRMTDAMRFEPAHIDVREGETVRLRVHNAGRVMHELVLGTPTTLAAHADAMRVQPGMAHAAPYIAHVAPGAAADIVWTFNRTGRFDFACLVAGHFEAGMAGTLTVRPLPTPASSTERNAS